MQDLTVTLIQTELFWEDISANLAMFDQKIDGISEKTDVIILPEMFTTGFTMNVEKAAESDDRLRCFLDRCQSKAKECPYPGKRYYRGRQKIF